MTPLFHLFSGVCWLLIIDDDKMTTSTVLRTYLLEEPAGGLADWRASRTEMRLMLALPTCLQGDSSIHPVLGLGWG